MLYHATTKDETGVTQHVDVDIVSVGLDLDDKREAIRQACQAFDCEASDVLTCQPTVLGESYTLLDEVVENFEEEQPK